MLDLCQEIASSIWDSHYVHGAPWSVANRLNGRRTGAFSWRPVLRPCQENRPIPTRPNPELRTWMAVWSGVISVSPGWRCDRVWSVYHLDGGVIGCDQCITWMAVWSGVISVSPRTLGMLRHLPTCDQPSWSLFRTHAKHHLHLCSHPAHHSHV